MRILVAGTRSLKPTAFMFNAALGLLLEPLAYFSKPNDRIVIVHGAAKGVDVAARDWALARGFEAEAHPANWDKYGKRAGPVRNAEMAKSGIDGAIFFWDGKSPGTKDMLTKIISMDIPYIVMKT